MAKIHGDGSVYQRRKDGLWVAAIVGNDGKRIHYYAHTKSEAMEFLEDAREKKRKNKPIPGVRLTLARYLDEYLQAKKMELRASTFKLYRGHIERHIRPALGRYKLVRLEPAHVARFLADKLEEGLSPVTVAQLRSILRAALSQAEDQELVGRNVAKRVRGPRIRRREVEPFTLDEVTTLFGYLLGPKGHDLQALWITMLVTGVRHAEALGLTWDDVELKTAKPVIHIRHALERVGGEYRLGELKTDKSRRNLPLDGFLVSVLQAQEDRQRFQETEAGKNAQGEPNWRNELNLVFTNEFGRPLHESTVGHHFHKVLEELGLPRRRVYDLRHSFATLAIAQGWHMREVMDALGHSQIALTMNTYGHIYDEGRAERAKEMGDLFRGLAEAGKKRREQAG